MYHTKDEALSRALQYAVLTIEDLRRENAEMRNFLAQNFRQYNPSNTYSPDANFSTLRGFVQEFESLSKTNKGHANLLNQENPYEVPERSRDEQQARPPIYDLRNPFY